jgi:phosphatidate cytidylyltransferase
VLRTRLISAAILVPLVVYGVLTLSTGVFALLLGMIFIAGMWEWARLVPLHPPPVRIIYIGVISGLLWLCWQTGLESLATPLLLVACAWWLCALLWLSRPQFCAENSTACMLAKGFAGALVCIPAWAALVLLHGGSASGAKLVLALLVMVWLADSGAYFAGRYLGKNKLAPVVSPGKTWEGVYGGLLASLSFAAVAGWLFSASLSWTLNFLLVALVAMLFSVVGDLLESLMKRQSGIKDSGHIIPGHGGIFDRIDSLVAAAPLFLAGYRWFGL